LNASSEGSPDQQPLLQRIDAICDAFEQALASQPDARVEDFLADWLATEQAALLAHLLELELDYRSRGERRFGARNTSHDSLTASRLSMISSLASGSNLTRRPGLATVESRRVVGAR